MTEIELILVDDGSKKACADLCDAIASSDGRVRVIHKKNGGISSARNVGIENARGEYIAFVDQDDEVLPEMYEELYEKAVETNADVVLSDFQLMYPDHNELYVTFDVHPNHHDTYRDMLMHGYGGNIWNLIIRHSLLNETGLRFPEHLKHCEDVYFSSRLFACTTSVAKVQKAFYKYNLGNPNQVSNNLDFRFTQDSMQYADETIDYLKKKGLYDEYVHELEYMISRIKTILVMDKRHYALFRQWHPESMMYLDECPSIGRKMKVQMKMVHYKLTIIPSILARLYNWKRGHR